MVQNTKESKALARRRLTMLFVYRLHFPTATALQARSLKDGQSQSQTGTAPQLPEGSPGLVPSLSPAAARLTGAHLPAKAYGLCVWVLLITGSWTKRGFIRQDKTRNHDERRGWCAAQGHLLVLEALKPPDRIQTSINPGELSLCFPICSFMLRSPGLQQTEA